MFYRVDEAKEQSGRGNSSAEGPSFQGEGATLQSMQTQRASERLRNSHNEHFKPLNMERKPVGSGWTLFYLTPNLGSWCVSPIPSFTDGETRAERQNWLLRDTPVLRCLLLLLGQFMGQSNVLLAFNCSVAHLWRFGRPFVTGIHVTTLW